MTAALPPLRECKVCFRRNRAPQRRGMCHACYERRRLAGQIESLVSARPAREHIVVLRIAKWGYRDIARAAGIDKSVIAHIVAGRVKIQAKTALRICEIDPSQRHRFVHPDRHRASGWDTRRRRAAQAQRPSWEQLRAEWDRKRAEAAARIQPPEPRPSAELVELAGLVAAVLSPDEDWREQALCAQIDADMFYPEKGGSTRDAKRVCAGCPVIMACLTFALEHDERFGIWGGLSERERRRLVKGVA